MARWIVPVVAVGVLSAGGFALAADRPGPVQTASTIRMTAACDAMHRSPVMQRMLDPMPAELREQCEAMHEEMLPMMEMMDRMSGMMMSGSGMMSGS